MSVAARVDATDGDAAPARTWTGRGRIDSGDDVERVLAAVTALGQRRQRTADLARVAGRADEVALTEPDGARVLPVAAELAPLLPWPGGLRRGATVEVTGSTSLLFALIAEAMSQGAWTAVVGLPSLNPAVSEEYGIDLARLALVPRPGEDWATTAAALIDGVDVVVLAPPATVPAKTAQALTARARRRGCVLIPVRTWPGCDVLLRVLERRWRGLGHGRGRLRAQEVTVQATGRGRAERPRQIDTALPPASIAARVGPLPGQIPGLPIGDPDRVWEPTVAVPPRPAPAREPDFWEQLFAAGPDGGTPARRAG